jgi:molybdopterin-dependent oxidoreductase alpha subunit
MANRVGWQQLWRAMRARNTCKTCALGMGGQAGGMRNERGDWPEVCKKSLQAMVADMQQGLQPAFFERFGFRELVSLTSRELEWCGRLTQPLYAGPSDTHYRVIDWDQALGKVTEKLRLAQPGQSFFYASGRSSNEAGFLLQLLARLSGTNYVNNCSYYCHQASGVGLKASLGTGTATVTLDDVEEADLFVLIGGNPSSNHPRLMRTLVQMRRRGGHVLVINPVKEVGLVNFRIPSDIRSLLFGSPIASLYVQPQIGGDIALLMGMAKAVLERDAAERDFIRDCTEGFEAFVQRVNATAWETIERDSGVSRSIIERAADYYAAARNVVFGWTMGVTQHEHGVENVLMIVNLALLRGMVGRPRAGLMPIRGHSNVQGMGSVGVTPQLKQAILDNLEKLLGIQLPRSAGLDTMGCMQAAGRGEIRAALCLGGNIYGSNPDANFSHRALGQVDLVTYLSTSLNTGHVRGRGRETLVLPVRARDEEPQRTTQESLFNFVRMSDGGPARLDGPRSEVEVIAGIGRMVFGKSSPVDWQALEETCHLRQMIARVVPGFEKLGEIDRNLAEFHIPGRILHACQFPTPSGKARFAAPVLPALDTANDQLRLMTVRSEGQFNTVVYEEEDIYRGQERRDVVLMNCHDIDRLGLRPDQLVTVRSRAGSLAHIHVREFDIHAGNALMYYPEANALVPTTTDPASKTPAFKSVLVSLEPESAAVDTQERDGERVDGQRRRRLDVVRG